MFWMRTADLLDEICRLWELDVAGIDFVLIGQVQTVCTKVFEQVWMSKPLHENVSLSDQSCSSVSLSGR